MIFKKLTALGNQGLSLLPVVVFVGILAFFFISNSFEGENSSYESTDQPILSSSGGCQPYTGPEITYQGGTYGKQTDFPVEKRKTVERGGRHIFLDKSDPVNYRLILTNVPMSVRYTEADERLGLTKKILANDPKYDKSIKYPAEVVTINGTKYAVLYPQNHGKLHYQEQGEVQEALGRKLAEVNFYDHGLVFLARLDENDKPIFVDTNKFKGIKKGLYILTDLFQNPSAAPLPQDAITECQGGFSQYYKAKGEEEEDNEEPVDPLAEAEEATDAAIYDDVLKTSIYFPGQEESVDKKELQLEYFLFQQNNLTYSSGEGGIWNIHCKPAIYLYPTYPTNINVKVNTKGELTYTDPKYPSDNSGWNVLAYPDGRLKYYGKNVDSLGENKGDDYLYPYLYYESKVPDGLINLPTKGLVVPYETLQQSYSVLLPKLGLNREQVKDFSDYWQKTLPYSPYYFLGIMAQKDIDFIEPLDINPSPVTNIRVRIYFKALDKKPNNSLELAQILPTINTPKYKGFTLVEWGGMVKTDPLHPFTCSN